MIETQFTLLLLRIVAFVAFRHQCGSDACFEEFNVLRFQGGGVQPRRRQQGQGQGQERAQAGAHRGGARFVRHGESATLFLTVE